MKWPTKHVLVRPASALVMALTLRGMSCFALTREEAGCEQAVARAFERYWVTTIECLVKCNEVPQATPTRSCAPEACLQKGRAKADEIIARRCVGAACPGCYPGGCPSYPDSVLDSVRSRAEALIGKLFCDDGASADGLTHAEGKCRESAARQLQRYVATFTECVGNCTRDVRGKKILADTCVLGNLDRARPLFDPKTLACLDRAAARLGESCTERCLDWPDCSGHSPCDEAAPAGTVGDLLWSNLDTIFCIDGPFCHDGLLAPGEECDGPICTPLAEPGCELDPRRCREHFFCGTGDVGTDCTCTPIPYECGNGIVDYLAGEECDPPGLSEFPCYPDDICNDQCRCASGRACLNDRLDPGEVCEMTTNEGCAPDEECFYCEQCVRL